MQKNKLHFHKHISASQGLIAVLILVQSPNVGLMLGQRRRQWPNINPTLGDCTLTLNDILTCQLHTQANTNVEPMLV